MKKVILALGLFSASQVSAQEYTPVHVETMSTLTSDSNVDKAPLVCANPPKVADLGIFNTQTTEMSRTIAARMGLPLGSLSTSSNSRVLVQDYSRTQKCTATDGKTQLIYGQAVRIIASSDGFDADGRFDLPSIAANTTLKNTSSNIAATVIGLNDPALLKLGNKIFGDFDVKRYKEVADLMTTMSNLAVDTANKGSPQLLGYATSQLDTSAPVMGAFAVQNIADNKSCQETKTAVPEASAAAVMAIEEAYLALMGTCSTSRPDPISRNAAKESLSGFKVKK